jgi:hypothetical protein
MGQGLETKIKNCRAQAKAEFLAIARIGAPYIVQQKWIEKEVEKEMERI